MKKIALLFSVCLLCITVTAQQPKAPDEIFGQLFIDVQMKRVFPDNKTFADCTPKKDPAAIVKEYSNIPASARTKEGLKAFVEANFIVPQPPNVVAQTDTVRDVVAHIKSLWKVLKRAYDKEVDGSSLLALPHPYIVPGGRFSEVYYWDSYFTMLGLKESGEWETIENMIKNFAYLIDTYGHIPNGNRTYYLSRSQPPYFSLMVDLLAAHKGDAVYKEYGDEMQKEWDYYMDKTAPTKHVVRLPDGSILNRYYDQSDKPRQESYNEDYTLSSKFYPESAAKKRRDLRSAAESGIDFSSRWLADGKSLSTIQTTDYIAVDLNSLLYHLEQTLAKYYGLNDNKEQQALYEKAAAARRKAIEKWCWSAAKGFYVDYNFITKKQSPELTLCGMEPFFLNVADKAHIAPAAKLLQQQFLKPGGWVTTLKNTGQQWDAPNGWAPLEWITIKGLENYGQSALARTSAKRWIALNNKVFMATGKLTEKYNVVNNSLEAGGGEYPGQDGFGWTNGVLLQLIAMYGK